MKKFDSNVVFDLLSVLFSKLARYDIPQRIAKARAILEKVIPAGRELGGHLVKLDGCHCCRVFRVPSRSLRSHDCSLLM
jgi:hypothetical protein